MVKKKTNWLEICWFILLMITIAVFWNTGNDYQRHQEQIINKFAPQFCQEQQYEIDIKLSEILSNRCGYLCLYNMSLIENQTWEYFENCVDYCLSFKYQNFTNGFYDDKSPEAKKCKVGWGIECNDIILPEPCPPSNEKWATLCEDENTTIDKTQLFCGEEIL